MGTEIERKFLLNPSWISSLIIDPPGITFKIKSLEFISQGYLQNDPSRVVRIRTTKSVISPFPELDCDGNKHKGLITIKGPTVGISRSEFEYEIPIADAEAMLKMCDNVVEKYRHSIIYTQQPELVWEIDQFCGALQGLIVAEVELKSVVQELILPDWVVKEVSHDARYFNSKLSQMTHTEIHDLLTNP